MYKLALKYAFFGVVSMICNLGVQYIVQTLMKLWRVLGPFEVLDILGLIKVNMVLMSGIFFGTLTGLIIKYILDKKYIFNYNTKSSSENRGKFFLYSFMGIFTTLIYLGFEISFDYLFEYSMAEYVGGAIGLTIGYVVKYNLDKRFVFKV